MYRSKTKTEKEVESKCRKQLTNQIHVLYVSQ